MANADLQTLMQKFKSGDMGNIPPDDPITFDKETAHDLITLSNIDSMKQIVSPEFWCDVCHGRGFVTIDSILQFCDEPNCPASKHARRESLIRLLKGYGDIPETYTKFTFDTWSEIHGNYRNGKQLGEMTIRYFANHPMTPFSMFQVMNWEQSQETLNRLERVELIEPNMKSQNIRDWREQVTIRLKGIEPFNIMNSFASGLVLSSPQKGTGKTGLAVSAAFHLIEQGFPVAFIHLPTLLRKIKNSYQDGYTGASTETLLEPILKSQILIVDEFNVPYESASPHDVGIVADIVNQRHGSGGKQPLMITTNCTQETFTAMWGSLVSSRVFEICHWIPMDGQPIRIHNLPIR